MSVTDRRKKTDFQNKMLARFPDQRVDPIILLLFEELAVRVNAAQVYPPGILDVVAFTTADLVNELRELTPIPVIHDPVIAITPPATLQADRE